MLSLQRSIFALLVLLAAIGRTDAQSVLLVPSQFATIQSAINAAGNGDMIQVAPGTYVGSINLGQKPVILQGAGPGVSILQGGPSGPVVAAVGTNAHTVIRGFTITGGTFSGLYLDGASPVIESCVISGNSTAFSGGGVRTESGAPTLLGCLIMQNSAGTEGGGVDVDTGSLTMIGCILRANSAPVGAAANAASVGSTLRLINCTIDGNIGSSSALRIQDGTTSSLENCVLYANSGAIVDASASAVMRHSIVFLNTPTTPVGFQTTNSDVQGGTLTDGNIDSDPLFVDPSNGDFSLSLFSPCRDSGDPMADPDADGSVVDMGVLVDHLHLRGSAVGNVHVAAGGFTAPFAQLRIDGSSGGANRRVHRPLSTSFVLSLIDPPGFPSGQPAAIAFHVGHPALNAPFFIGSVGEFAFSPSPAQTILIADGFGGPSLLGPAISPWFVGVPFGVGFPIVGTMQALYFRGGQGPQLRVSNAVILDIS